MQFYKYKIIVMLSALFSITAWWNAATAQEELIILNHKDIFMDMKRPAVNFPHELHESALDDEGCGACHHIFDVQQKKLIYEEGEEQECKTCHSLKKEDGTPALKEAFHKSCTGCHRHLKKNGSEKSGPTTCGECHQKHSM